MVGSSLRSYRIEAKLGAGGMGVVYKAVDSRLGRTAAIKTLPASALNTDRMRRFVQEARAASSLNHPNIVTIYDIDTQEMNGETVHYIAMEYVAGETLDHMIGRKGLRVRDALKYGAQVADALAAAHAAGIVHRDLKPSNIMVTSQGLVKILDFGLAKVNEEQQVDAYAETVHGGGAPLTEEGTILGTVAYMSPEQAEGKKLDARSDIFSFGSVLYEMVTGRRAFPGGSKISSLSAVMYKDPQPPSQAVPEIPPEVDRVIARCLKKDPERRWQTMVDLKVALEELREEMEVSGAGLARPPVTKRNTLATRLAVWIVLGLALGLALGAFYVQRFFRPDSLSFQRLTFRRGDVTSARFAPGGSVVYGAEWDGAPSTLFSGQPGNREARALGLPTGRILSISQRGEMAILVGGGAVGTLARVPFAGGAPREVLENVSGADWGPDGESLAVMRTAGSGRHNVEYPIGTVLYEMRKLPPFGMGPRVSVDGKLVAFFDYDMEVGDYALCVVGPNHPRQVLARGWRGVGSLNWSPDGHEIWFSGVQQGSEPSLFAVDLAGKQRLVSQFAGWIVMQDVARDGRVLLSTDNSRMSILYLPPDGSSQRDLAWMDISRLYELSSDAQSALFVELSDLEGRNAAIYLRKTDGSPAVRLGFGIRPSLSPDAKWVVCIRRDVTSRLLLIPTGPGESRVLHVEGMHYDTVEWFPDNKRILFTGNETGHEVRTWTYDPDGDKLRPLTREGVRGTRVSPDGKWFTVQDGHKLLLSAVGSDDSKAVADLGDGETVVRWSEDGRFLFLQQPQADTMHVARLEVATGLKTPWRVLKVPEPGAFFYPSSLALSADGKACAVSFQRDLAILYLVKGLK